MDTPPVGDGDEKKIWLFLDVGKKRLFSMMCVKMCIREGVPRWQVMLVAVFLDSNNPNSSSASGDRKDGW